MNSSNFLTAVAKAIKLNMLGSGGVLVLKDFLQDCTSRIEKNKTAITMFQGENICLARMADTLADIVKSYNTMEEDELRDQEEQRKAESGGNGDSGDTKEATGGQGEGQAASSGGEGSNPSAKAKKSTRKPAPKKKPLNKDKPLTSKAPQKLPKDTKDITSLGGKQ